MSQLTNKEGINNFQAVNGEYFGRKLSCLCAKNIS
jgi:hypothetical protein